MQQHGSKYFRVDTASTTGGLGSKDYNIFFSDSRHDAYQIKRNGL